GAGGAGGSGEGGRRVGDNGGRRRADAPRGGGWGPTRPGGGAGVQTDPPVSVPIEASAMPAATLAPDPPLDPPGDRAGSCGFLAGPNAESSFVVPNANSCRLVFPTNTAPACRRCAIDGAPRCATWPLRTRDAAAVAPPRLPRLSLT